jgi:serine/threonine-protein kinase
MVGSIIAERYHILKKLGEGGMGSVYLAEHVKMGRKAALKVMNPGMAQDPDAIARFNREAANASRLNHPNVCAIYDFGETTDGLIYLAMEFIEGQSLTSLIEKTGALTPPRAAAIIHQAADALQVAHDYGIVHRDLKPDNIMITKARDGSDVAKVVDFGIAKASSSDAQKVTKTGLVVGTPEYMSPEQLAGDKLDGRSDIYSLGLVAFNCLTGKLPFPSNSAQEAMIMRLTDEPKTLAEMRPDISWPDELQAVMTKALARDVNERYQSAAQFGRDLARAVENMPQAVAAAAGTQVIDASAAPSLAKTVVGGPAAPAPPSVPKTRVASPAEKAAAPAAAAPAKKSTMPLVAAAAVVVLGVGGYLAWKATGGGQGQVPTAANSLPPSVPPPATRAGGGAQSQVAGGQPQSTTNRGPSVDLTSRRGSTAPGPGGTRTTGPGGAEAPPPSVAALDAVLAKWSHLLRGEDISNAEARQIIAEVTPASEKLTGSKQGDAYTMIGLAHLKLENDLESCRAFKRALDVATGNSLKIADLAYKGRECK